MLTKKKKLRIAKSLAANWYIATRQAESASTIDKISRNTFEIAYVIGGMKMTDLVSKLYDELAKVKEKNV